MSRKYIPAGEIEPHPLAMLFPGMADDEFRGLVEDMRANGQLVPVTIHEGKVLDGRHRVRALNEIGEPIWVVDFDGDDPAGYVMSLNLHRRSLNEAQRGMVAAKLANMRQGERTDLHSANLQNVSQSRAAQMLNVSTRTVASSRKVLETAPEVAAVVDLGHMSLNLATKVAALPKPQRAEILAKEDKGEMRRALALVAPPAQPADAAHKNTGRTRLLTPPQPVGVTGSHQFGLMAWNQIERMANDDPETVRALKTLMDKCAKKLEVAQSITGAIA